MIIQLDLIKNMHAKRQFIEAQQLRSGPNPFDHTQVDRICALPFSFLYEDQPSEEYLSGLPTKVEVREIDENRTEHTVVWYDSKSGLQIRYIAVEYADYPVVEWTIYFKNCGSENTPILKDIRCLDTTFYRGNEREFVLHGHKGDWCVAESYEPYKLTLDPQNEKHFAPQSGKSTGGPDGWPYYNLQMSGEGIIIALGWPGQWASSFVRDAHDGLKITAGQESTNLYLKPGEEIRTPLTVLLFWKGDDTVQAQNLWRRWFWTYNTPRVNGVPPEPLTQIMLARDFVDGEDVMWEQANIYLEAGIKPEVCWRDANWYPFDNGPYKDGDSWLNTGTWEIDTKRYPNGFKVFSDWAHARGMKFLLWFEPERVGNPNSSLAVNHPEWMLDDTSHGPILNLGDPAALSWLIDHVDSLIKSQGIDWYREDMNGVGPLKAWRNNDTEDRQGITENYYVQGHLDFWDALLSRNPGLRIDTCASGGRRNDLETMRRAVPLLRSDYQFPDDLFPQHKMRIVREANQAHTYGISSWFPYYGSSIPAVDSYSVRSFYMPAFGAGTTDWEKDEKLRADVKRAYEECRIVAPIMLGDYYPLTPYSLELDQWIAWQFDRPEIGDGLVQAFRRIDNEEAVRKVQLSGLDPDAKYEVTDIDLGIPESFTGIELMKEGLSLEILDRPGALVLTYKRMD